MFGSPDGLAGLAISLLDVFRDIEVAVTLALILAGGGVLLLLWFALGIAAPAFAQIGRAIRVVRGAETRGRFAQLLPEVDQVLGRQRLLRSGWARYRQGFVASPPGVGDPWRARTSAARYYSLSGLEQAGLDLKLFQALPNYFIGVGLMLTFMGLVAALYFASQGVGSADVKDAQAALGSLLQAATFKFLTSIAGLFASLVLSIGYRLLTIELGRRADRLARLLDDRVPVLDPAEQGAQQVRLLEQMPGILAQRIGEEFEIRLRDTLPEILADATDRFGASGNDPVGQMRLLMEEFRAALSQSTFAELQGLADALIEIRGSLRGLHTGFRDSGDDFAKRVEQSSAAWQTNILDSGRVLQDTLAQIEQTASKLRLAAEPVGKVAERFDKAAQDIVAAADAILRSQGQMGQVAEGLGQTANVLKASMTEYRERFAEVDRSLGQAFKVFAEGSETQRRHIQDFVREVDQHLDKALSALGTGVAELTQSVEDLQRTLASGRTP